MFCIVWRKLCTWCCSLVTFWWCKRLVGVGKSNCVVPVQYMWACVAVASWITFVWASQNICFATFQFGANQMIPEVIRSANAQHGWLARSLFAAISVLYGVMVCFKYGCNLWQARVVGCHQWCSVVGSFLFGLEAVLCGGFRGFTYFVAYMSPLVSFVSCVNSSLVRF